MRAFALLAALSAGLMGWSVATAADDKPAADKPAAEAPKDEKPTSKPADKPAEKPAAK